MALPGTLIPPTTARTTPETFAAIYPKLAKEQNVPLVPFLLRDVGGEAQYNQRDGIHPTAEGHRIVAKNVAPQLRDLVAALQPGEAPRVRE